MRAYVVDAFTDAPFHGNPAGVVLLDAPADPEWMQSVAAELKHSETAFVDTSVAGTEPKPLRWFTPTTEVDLCGHATLAAAHVLGGSQRFTTRSGILTCTARADGMIELDFPADPTTPAEAPSELTAGLPGVTIRQVCRGRTDLLVELDSAEEVRGVRPDFTALAELPVRAVIVTARGERDNAIVSRVFAPAVGIPEDPVTGSAHCTLATWWQQRLGATELDAEQASERGGALQVRLASDRVLIAGRAVTVLAGDLHA
ncbi:PhzF family phenazine biosynthesis protein [Saccharopolyspora rectivirgula]|uniref:Oxidoreductase n=1 Tax=Saccharopolyspora rectivirgula TaxID=28042 RepID=A0A073AZE9_9PSEU|nr:PhzF family phenazine biosynthesis protein [Saccharopolyspora rectivirgula]KEI45113.1 oxidoreductase [Saccharopolyspora rectivirgula]